MFIFLFFLSFSFGDEFYGFKLTGKESPIIFSLESLENVINSGLFTNSQGITFNIKKDGDEEKIVLTLGIAGKTISYDVELEKIEETLTELNEKYEITEKIENGIEILYESVCLSDFLPEQGVSADLLAALDLKYIKTQFGVSIHTYPSDTTQGGCRGIDTLIEVTKNGQEINEHEFTIPGNLPEIPAQKFINGTKAMFKYIKNNVELPNLNLDIPVLEFDGKILKKYIKVDGKFKLDGEVEIVDPSKIISSLIPCVTGKQCNGEMSYDEDDMMHITAECDGNFAFGWSGDSLAQFDVSAGCNIDTDSRENRGFKLNIEAQSDNKKHTIKINDKEYYFDGTMPKISKTGLVETLGGFMDFEIGKCVSISFFGLFDVAAYKIDVVTAGKDNTQYVAFVAHIGGNCESSLIDFQIIIGKYKEIENVNKDYELLTFTNKDDCEKGNEEKSISKTYPSFDTCVFGKKFVLEDGKLVLKDCNGLKSSLFGNEEEVYECGKCVKCDREMFEKTQNYAYLKCSSKDSGSSSTFFFLVVLILFFIF